VGCDNPQHLISQIISVNGGEAYQIWHRTDPTTAVQIQQSPDQHLVVFGQMAGLILKNALLRPLPMTNNNNNINTHTPFSLDSTTSGPFKETMLFGLGLQHVELRNVITSIVADCAVSTAGIQPQLHITSWPQLMPFIVQNLNPTHFHGSSSSTSPALLGCLSTVQKMFEDDPEEIPTSDVDAVMPLLLQLFQSPNETVRLQAVSSISTYLSSDLPIPNSLVVQFSNYLDGLSHLASNDTSLKVRAAVCGSLVTLLELHTQYLEPQWSSICMFMLQQTGRNNSSTASSHGHSHDDDDLERVCTQACEFWLVYSSLPEDVCTNDMVMTVQNLLPRLIPILLQNMVYSEEQQMDLLSQNEIELDEETNNNNGSPTMKPIFHRSKSNKRDKSTTSDNDGGDGADENDDDDGDDDDDDLEWNLRKYAGASLDSIASIYGPGPVLPALLPSLEQGLSSSDTWVQEACILALGAIADGCREEMNSHMANLYPYMMNILSQPEVSSSNNNNSNTVDNLPQLKCICAWTIGRYAEWAVDMYHQQQQMTRAPTDWLTQTLHVLLQRLNSDRHRKVQVACASSLGVFVETAGESMTPFIPDIYTVLVSAISRYHGKSLVIVFDTLGMMADSIGPAVGERDLPSVYVPPLLTIWNNILRQDATNQILLSLMESLAAIALACGVNYQPFAFQTFDTSMATIEQIQLMLATIEDPSEEDGAPITCATDLLDGLCEGLGSNFAALIQSSARYGQHFASVLHALCSHQVAGVRMSGLALLGDLARNAPSILSPALPQLIQDALLNLEVNGDDDVSASLCNNAAWSIGEICVQCGENAAPLEPFASTLVQKLVALLMGNTVVSKSSRKGGFVTEIPGLAENAAACMGRLANVNPVFVATDLPRFLLGWCDGMSKISDMDEKRDAFSGFCKAVYANPQSIQLVGGEVHDTVSSIIFAIATWHLPPEAIETGSFTGDFEFQPFPPSLSDLGHRLNQLLIDIKGSVDEHTWNRVRNSLTVKLRRLMQEVYNV
jgi:transportin-1